MNKATTSEIDETEYKKIITNPLIDIIACLRVNKSIE